jgi:hypothetical protein
MVEFSTGETHEGVFRCAQAKIDKLIPRIRVSLEKHAGYKLVICGHSLGRLSERVSECVSEHSRM